MFKIILKLFSINFLFNKLNAYSTGWSQSDDEIIALPGWDSKLPSKQFSGYLNVSDTSHLHYWLVNSENDPDNDPTVVWFNGVIIHPPFIF